MFRSSAGRAHLVTESAKMMKRTDPSIELSAAALTDMDWNTELLKKCGERLDWISIHGYWDFHEGKNHLADYETCLTYMKDLDRPVRRVRGLLEALEMDHIKIAYDEWNLRAWYHPNIMDLYQGRTSEEYLDPRDENDRNEQYNGRCRVQCLLSEYVYQEQQLRRNGEFLSGGKHTRHDLYP